MKKVWKMGVILSTMCFAASALAGSVTVDKPWLYETFGGATKANVYFHITSDEAVTLVGATSPLAEQVILETMDHSQGTMKIVRLEKIELPAGKTVDMTSEHRYHLKMLGVDQALKAGTTVPVTLQLQTSSGKTATVDFAAKVRP